MFLDNDAGAWRCWGWPCCLANNDDGAGLALDDNAGGVGDGLAV